MVEESLELARLRAENWRLQLELNEHPNRRHTRQTPRKGSASGIHRATKRQITKG